MCEGRGGLGGIGGHVTLNASWDLQFSLLPLLPCSPSPPPLVLSLSYEEEQEELWCNYERYRTLVQSAFKGISEEKCLKEIEIEDMYPETKKKINKEKAK